MPDTWHNVTVTWRAMGTGVPGTYTFDETKLYLDGLLRRALPSQVVVAPPNIDVGWWLWVLGLNNRVVWLDEVEFREDMLSPEIINARVTAVNNQCLGPVGDDISRYMVENMCASCNNLQCKIEALRTCRPIEIKGVEPPKNLVTEYLWISLSGNNQVSQMSAMETNLGQVVHRYKICGPAATPCQVDYGSGCPASGDDGNQNPGDGCNTTCANVNCGAIATDPSRTAVNVEDGLAAVAYRGQDYVALFHKDTGLMKLCGGVLGNGANGKGVAFDSNGDLWAGMYVSNPNGKIVKINKLPGQANCGFEREIGATGGIPVYGMVFDAEDNLFAISGFPGIVNGVVPRFEKLTQLTANATVTSGTGGDCTVPGVMGCSWWSTPGFYGIGVDLKGRGWGSHYDPGGVFRITPEGSGQTAIGTQPPYVNVPGNHGRGVGLDESGRIWVAYDDSNAIVAFDPDTMAVSDSVTIPGFPLGVSGDSAGYIWAVTQNRGQACRYNPLVAESVTNPVCYSVQSGQLGVNGWGTYMYSDFMGANRAFVLREAASVFPGGADSIGSFETMVTSWSGRWGKILYDAQEPGSSSVELYVYVTNDPSNFPSPTSPLWIPVDDRKKPSDNFNDRIGSSPLITADQYQLPGEITGRYMKLKVILRTDKDGNEAAISNLRITCVDKPLTAGGRYICR